MIQHGYSGSCAPDTGCGIGYSTFSVGIFEVVPTASGKGTKRGPVKVRVRGLMTNPQAVYDAAQRIVEQLDAGTYSGPKNVTVAA
jgi:Ni,Fe-hydrogenase III small subunit